MKTYIYMILITAVLFLLYKKRRGAIGFKLILFEFTLKLNKSMLKDIVILSGGDLNAVKKYVT